MLPLCEPFGRGKQSGGEDVAGDGKIYSFQSRGILLRTCPISLNTVQVLMLLQVTCTGASEGAEPLFCSGILAQAKDEIWLAEGD